MEESAVKILKNVHFRGNLYGKYKASPIRSWNEDSKISLLETSIEKTEKCSELDFLFSESNILEYNKVDDVNIELSNNEGLGNYTFKENVLNLKIGNVLLSDQTREGSTTYGVIKGNCKFLLQKEEELKISIYEKPEENLDIVFPDIEKIKRKESLFNFFKTALVFSILIILIILFVRIVSSVDFDLKKQKINKLKNGVETYITSRSIRLSKLGSHNYAVLTLDGIEQKFMLDTGASMTTVPSIFIDKLIKKGYLNPAIHFLRYQEFFIADGKTLKGGVWRIPKVKFGNQTLYNVEFSSVSSENAPFLLGMSTLEKLGKYSIFPNENKIIIYK